MSIPFYRIQMAVRKVYGGVCQYCGAKDAKDVEHIVPRARGGADTLSNLTLSCSPCNLRKRTILLDPMHYAIAVSRAAAKAPAIQSLLEMENRRATRKPVLRKQQEPKDAPPKKMEFSGVFNVEVVPELRISKPNPQTIGWSNLDPVFGFDNADRSVSVQTHLFMCPHAQITHELVLFEDKGVRRRIWMRGQERAIETYKQVLKETFGDVLPGDSMFPDACYF